MFEDYGVFARVGTELVGKEMYDFRDRGDRHLALRPDQHTADRGFQIVVCDPLRHSARWRTGESCSGPISPIVRGPDTLRTLGRLRV